MREIVFQKNDKVEWLDQRFYKFSDSLYVPSVTTILQAYPKDASFFEWLKNNGQNADEIRDDAGESGSKVHFAIELFDKDIEVNWADAEGKPQYAIHEWQMICRYMEFYQKVKYELICNEISYASENLMYGGTLDKICRFNGKTWLIDNKTSKSLYNHFWIQLVAYKDLWEEMNPEILIDEVAILHLKAQTRTEGKGDAIQGRGWALRTPEKPVDYYRQLFKSTYNLWLDQNPSAKPLNMVYPASFKKAPELITER